MLDIQVIPVGRPHQIFAGPGQHHHKFAGPGHWTKTGIEILWNAGLMLWMEMKIILVVESMILGLSGSLYSPPLQSGHIFPCIMENRQHMA